MWSPCSRRGFRRSTIVSVDAATDHYFVEYKDDDEPASSGQFHVARSDVRPLYDSGVRDFEDNTSMTHLDDANILDNMRRRFEKDKIYTYTAGVLLAVNPYKQIESLYTAETMREYRGKSPSAMAPHPYAIADIAYRHLNRERRNQALVISGESGAGKTETAKITMKYLASVSRTDQAHAGGMIQDKIINANPILEAFGNASTVRNMNSSRFGKYNEMSFDRVGSLVGAGIRTFLLESSRVVSQQPGERNYHVFYHLLAGMDADAQDRLMLEPNGRYKLLHNNGASPFTLGSREFKEHGKQFQELQHALASFLDKENQTAVWNTLAALIHLGEVEFLDLAGPEDREDENPAEQAKQPKVAISQDTKERLEYAANLLAIPETSLEQVLTYREMRVKHQGGRISNFNCPRTVVQATATLQCIIKIFYKRLFDKIVEKINAGSRGGVFEDGGSTGLSSIGTLDIYGFERLQTNSFEQLCINLANERLQQFFVEEVLEAEQKTYAEESLNIKDLQLPDSGPVVRSIQKIMDILDDHSLKAIKSLTTGCGDTNFCAQVHKNLVQDARSTAMGPVTALRLKGTRSNNGPGLHDGFQIKHYAGDVSYLTRGWIDKNNDSSVPEVETLLLKSSERLVAEMADVQALQASSGERLNSVGMNYMTNLNHLLATLKLCQVHYIRCFNPNQNKQPRQFDTKYVLEQVIHCGTVELVKIMHNGFPHRCFLKDLRSRFRNLLPSEFDHYSDRDFVHAVMIAFELSESQWTLGTKRLFLKAGQLRVLENLQDLGAKASREMITKIRMQFARKKVRAAVRMVFSAICWRNETQRQKRIVVRTKVKKAAFILVRLYRWLGRARATLYPEIIQPDAESDSFALDIPCSHGSRSKAPRARSVQIFTAPNVLLSANEIETESVIFLAGGRVLCADLPSEDSTRLQQGMRVPPLQSAGLNELSDVRVVDVEHSGKVLPLAALGERHMTSTIALCQNQAKPSVFASCSSAGDIKIWRWCGSQNSIQKRAVELFHSMPCSLTSSLGKMSCEVLKMSFLPEVPDFLARTGCSDVLCLLLSWPNRSNTVALTVVTFFRGHAAPIMHAPEVVEIDPTEKSDVDAVPIFDVSHSGRFLIVGGRNLLQFWELFPSDNPQGPALRLMQDVVQYFNPNRVSNTSFDMNFTSCLPMPPVVAAADRQSLGMTDWIIIGCHGGSLLGWSIIQDQRKSCVDFVQSGKLIWENWPQSSEPIVALLGCFMPETIPLKSKLASKMDPCCLQSLSADGTLTSWEMQKGFKISSQRPVARGACVAGSRPLFERGRGESLVIADEGRLLFHRGTTSKVLCKIPV